MTTTPPSPEPAPSPESPSVLNEPEPPKAPETYAEFTVPEGFTLDKDVAKQAGEMFKGMNLSQEQAQSLINFYVDKTKETAQQPYDLWKQTQDGWIKEVKAHPEIGGKLDQVKVEVARAIDGLGDPQLAAQFREAMDFTGAGNNPAFIRVFYKLAQLVNEGGPVSGGQPSAHGQSQSGTSARPSLAQAMYPGGPKTGPVREGA